MSLRRWHVTPRRCGAFARLFVMGGVFSTGGNTTPVAEFNLWADPEAARAVFAAGLPLVVVPLDVTERVVLTPERLEATLGGRKDLLAQFLRDTTRIYFTYHREREGLDGAYLHDPVAVAAVLWPELFELVEAHVEVETAGTLTRGMTVAAWAGDRRWRDRSLNARVAVAVDAEAVLERFLDRVAMAKP